MAVLQYCVLFWKLKPSGAGAGPAQPFAALSSYPDWIHVGWSTNRFEFRLWYFHDDSRGKRISPLAFAAIRPATTVNTKRRSLEKALIIRSINDNTDIRQ